MVNRFCYLCCAASVRRGSRSGSRTGVLQPTVQSAERYQHPVKTTLVPRLWGGSFAQDLAAAN